MRLALFLGCKIPASLPLYGQSTRAVLAALDVEVVDLELGCCGYPVRSLHRLAFLLSSARNLALAERQGLDIVTPCQCCFGSLKHADHWLRRDPGLRAEIRPLLAAEGLSWEGGARVKHLLSVLADDLGVAVIRERVREPLTGLRVAAHYGCHALRPSRITRFDNPLAPTIFEKLVAATGAEPMDWPRRLECCGNPLADRNELLARKMTAAKLLDARQSGAHCLATACTYCQIQFESAQGCESGGDRTTDGDPLPVLLFTQILGRSLGLPARALGLSPHVDGASLRDLPAPATSGHRAYNRNR